MRLSFMFDETEDCVAGKGKDSHVFLVSIAFSPFVGQSHVWMTRRRYSRKKCTGCTSCNDTCLALP